MVQDAALQGLLAACLMSLVPKATLFLVLTESLTDLTAANQAESLTGAVASRSLYLFLFETGSCPGWPRIYDPPA